MERTPKELDEITAVKLKNDLMEQRRLLKVLKGGWRDHAARIVALAAPAFGVWVMLSPFGDNRLLLVAAILIPQLFTSGFTRSMDDTRVDALVELLRLKGIDVQKVG